MIIPRGYRPLWQEYITVGEILSEYSIDDFYQLSEQSFLHEVMQRSNGSLNPVRVKTIYNQLMNEAGL